MTHRTQRLIGWLVGIPLFYLTFWATYWIMFQWVLPLLVAGESYE